MKKETSPTKKTPIKETSAKDKEKMAKLEKDLATLRT